MRTPPRLLAAAIMLAACTTSNRTTLEVTAATTANGQAGESGMRGGRIVFVRDRGAREEIFVMDADGTNERRVTTNGVPDTHPAWSPHGERIVFVSERDATPDISGDAAREIYIMDADGTNVVRLTRNSAVDFHPEWSPDGKRIVFWSDRDGNAEIYVMNVDGSKQERLTNHPAIDRTGGWSPDGQKIVFHSERDPPPSPLANTAPADIYVMNADGTGVVRLTTHPARDQAAAWSPDGR